jgi:hypothetical protein
MSEKKEEIEKTCKNASIQKIFADNFFALYAMGIIFPASTPITKCLLTNKNNFPNGDLIFHD